MTRIWPFGRGGGDAPPRQKWTLLTLHERRLLLGILLLFGLGLAVRAYQIHLRHAAAAGSGAATENVAEEQHE